MVMLEKDWKNPTGPELRNWCIRALDYLDILDVFIKGSLPDIKSATGFTVSAHVGQNSKNSFRVLYFLQSSFGSLPFAPEHTVLEFGKVLSKIMGEYPSLSTEQKRTGSRLNPILIENLCLSRVYHLLGAYPDNTNDCLNRLRSNYSDHLSKINISVAKEKAAKINERNHQNRAKREKERFMLRESEVIDFVKEFIIDFHLQDHPELVMILLRLPLQSMSKYLSKGKTRICPYINIERIQEAVKLSLVEKIIKS